MQLLSCMCTPSEVWSIQAITWIREAGNINQRQQDMSYILLAVTQWRGFGKWPVFNFTPLDATYTIDDKCYHITSFVLSIHSVYCQIWLVLCLFLLCLNWDDNSFQHDKLMIYLVNMVLSMEKRVYRRGICCSSWNIRSTSLHHRLCKSIYFVFGQLKTQSNIQLLVCLCILYSCGLQNWVSFSGHVQFMSQYCLRKTNYNANNVYLYLSGLLFVCDWKCSAQMTNKSMPLQPILTFLPDV